MQLQRAGSDRQGNLQSGAADMHLAGLTFVTGLPCRILLVLACASPPTTPTLEAVCVPPLPCPTPPAAPFLACT